MRVRKFSAFVLAIGSMLLLTLAIAAQAQEAKTTSPHLRGKPTEQQLSEASGNLASLGYTSDITSTSAFTVHLPLVINCWPPYPLFVGLQLRWDGDGYIRGGWYYDIGWHLTRDCNGLTDPDTIRCHAHSWYDPNPLDLDSETWDSYYSVSTGYFKSSSAPSDPSWKWGHPWILPYDWQFHDGQTFSIDGQAFTVSGPHSGYTAFGQAVQYWQLVNRDKFLYWDGGGDWKQYVHAGDITLWYDAGNTRLLLHCDVLRRDYYKGQQTNDTVQYIDNLTSTNAFSSVGLVTEPSADSRVPLPHPNAAAHEISTDIRDSLRDLGPMPVR